MSTRPRLVLSSVPEIWRRLARCRICNNNEETVIRYKTYPLREKLKLSKYCGSVSWDMWMLTNEGQGKRKWDQLPGTSNFCSWANENGLVVQWANKVFVILSHIKWTPSNIIGIEKVAYYLLLLLVSSGSRFQHLPDQTKFVFTQTYYKGRTTNKLTCCLNLNFPRKVNIWILVITYYKAGKWHSIVMTWT